MNTKAETQAAAGPLDTIKWLLALALVAGGIYSFYHFAQYPMLYRVLALLPVIGIALWLALLTQSGAAFWDLVKHARLEWYKIVWPSRQETTQTTLIVLLVVFLMSIVLWLLDMLFGWLASLIIG